MKPHIAIVAAALLFFPGCRDESKLSGQQENYEVIQEGAASGVAATIGEGVPPMTATNADTTTAFQLPVGAPSATALPPGTIAGTIPQSPTNNPSPPPTTPGATASAGGSPSGILVAQPSARRQPPAPATPVEPAQPAEASPETTTASESPAEPSEEPAEDEPETTETQPPTV